MSQLDEAFERFTSKMSDGGPPEKLPQREVTFLMPSAACAPGVFPKDFRLTLRSLTPEAEMQAARGCDGDPIRMALIMAKSTLHAFGDALPKEEELEGGELMPPGVPVPQMKQLSGPHREFLWRALDQAGRNLCVKRFGELGTVDPDAEGKSDASVSAS